jgi:hypothetical protein
LNYINGPTYLGTSLLRHQFEPLRVPPLRALSAMALPSLERELVFASPADSTATSLAAENQLVTKEAGELFLVDWDGEDEYITHLSVFIPGIVLRIGVLPIRTILSTFRDRRNGYLRYASLFAAR